MNTLIRCGRGAAIALALGLAGAPARGESLSVASGTLERATALVRNRAYGPAADSLRRLLSLDPGNRPAKELLAFALESAGDLEGERRVRAALAAEFQRDAGVQADYGRALERSGDDGGALQAYRRAWELSSDRPAPGLGEAIARIRGRTATEVGMPLLTMLSDPEASASAAQVGAAIPFGSRDHISVLAARSVATDRVRSDVKTQSDVLAMTLVLRRRGGQYWTAGPRLHRLTIPGSTQSDLGLGGAVQGLTTLGPLLEADVRGEVETPWDEAAIAMLRGGRTSFAEGHLYAHSLDRQLLLQVGARRRRLSILGADPWTTPRPRAWQSLLLGGADVVLWRNPRAMLQGEMLDEALVAPAGRSSSVTLAYRHYDVVTRSTPEFSALFALAPRGAVDEASLVTTVVTPRRDLRLDVNAGLARDAALRVGEWRAGGALLWAPRPSTRFSLGYDEATNLDSGLRGRRRAGGVSVHVDL